MKYIELNEQRGEVSVNFDRYFEYLKSARSQISAQLYDYASKLEHYSLDGNSSLHDAWLSAAQFAYREKELTLEFLGARHDRKLIFKYTGVKTYTIDLSVQFTHGDGDVLVQEFRVDDGFVTHEIVFSGNRTIVIASKSVNPSIQFLQASDAPS